jgi:hypothetical protein
MKKLFLLAMVLLVLAFALPAQAGDAAASPPAAGMILEAEAVLMGAVNPIVVELQQLRDTISGIVVIGVLIALGIMAIAAYFFFPQRFFAIPGVIGVAELSAPAKTKPGNTPAARKKPAAAAGDAKKAGIKTRPKIARPSAATVAN